MQKPIKGKTRILAKLENFTLSLHYAYTLYTYW